VKSPVNIIPINSASDIKRFLSLPYDLYKDDPLWRAPLRFERQEQLRADKNPGAPRSRQLFLAVSGAQLVGRIAAFTLDSQDTLHQDNTGFFWVF
jgi:hypothetical protein